MVSIFTNRRRILLVLGWLSLTTLQDCSSDDAAPVEPILVAGYQVSNGECGATLWTNGTAKIFSDHPCANLRGLDGVAHASAVFVSGNDVYVAGQDGSQNALYWKNGVSVQLSMPEAAPTGFAKSIFVSGDNVHVTGYGAIDGIYWINGVGDTLSKPSPLPAGEINLEPVSIHGNGTDIVIAGTLVSETSRQAVYWLNGVPFLLDSLEDHPVSLATGVFMNGNDVYVSGYLQTSSFHSGTQIAVYWKNGELVELPGEYGKATSIFVSENNLYVAGSSVSAPVIWKNGQYAALTIPIGMIGEAVSVFVKGDDVYAAGGLISIESAGNGILSLELIPVYWKNETVNSLHGFGGALSIVVLPLP